MKAKLNMSCIRSFFLEGGGGTNNIYVHECAMLYCIYSLYQRSISCVNIKIYFNSFQLVLLFFKYNDK